MINGLAPHDKTQWLISKASFGTVLIIKTVHNTILFHILFMFLMCLPGLSVFQEKVNNEFLKSITMFTKIITKSKKKTKTKTKKHHQLAYFSTNTFMDVHMECLQYHIL